MADEQVVEDTVQAPSDPTETGQTPPSTEETGSETELIFGKYKDMDEAAKGWEELNQTYGKQAQELGSLRQKVEQLSSQAEQTGVLRDLVETLKPKEEPTTPQWESIEQSLIADGIDEDVAKAQVKALQYSAAWQQQGEESVKSSVLSEVKRLEAELAAEREARVKLTNDYQENQELIDEMVENGMEINAAIKMAKKVSDAMPAKAPGRTNPPPSVDNGRVTTEPPKPEVILTPDDKVAIAGGLGKSVDELEKDGTFAMMEAEEKARQGVQ